MVLIVVLICALFLKILQLRIYEKYWNKNLSVHISLKSTACVSMEENVLTEVISNNKKLPLARLHVKFSMPRSFLFENEENTSVSDCFYRDDLFTIMGRQTVTRKLKFVCSKRGCFQVKDTDITSSDLFLSKIFADKISNQITIHVYPKKVDLSFFDIPFKTITGTFVSKKTLIEDPFEFKGIREYQPYDSIHNINWKSSAKYGQLQVNTFFMTSSQSVKILLNLNTNIYLKDERLLEEIISLASSLAEKFIGIGVSVAVDCNGLDIFTNEHLYCESGSGLQHMVSIDTMLSRIDLSKNLLNFMDILNNHLKSQNENSYFIIISNAVLQEYLDLYLESKVSGVNSFFIVPELKNFDISVSAKDLIKWDVEY